MSKELQLRTTTLCPACKKPFTAVQKRQSFFVYCANPACVDEAASSGLDEPELDEALALLKKRVEDSIGNIPF